MHSNDRNRRLRIRKQMDDFKKRSYDYESIEILDLDQNYDSATFALAGPVLSPYKGYWFRVFVQWPIDYPWIAPKITFIDKIWNPYIDFQTNKICMDILECNFSPALLTPQTLLSIISLLAESKIDSYHSGFANPKAASQMMNNYPSFCEQATKFCQSYSFKKKDIHLKIKMTDPEVHQIKAEGDQLIVIVEAQSKNPKMAKNPMMAKKNPNK